MTRQVTGKEDHQGLAYCQDVKHEILPWLQIVPYYLPFQGTSAYNIILLVNYRSRCG